MSCYSYYTYSLSEEGHYDNSIDCTYVLVMENSSRKNNIINEINRAQITSRVVIQYNKGYKLCHKQGIHKPNYDLCHANLTAFKHALAQGYKRILLLEDDCQFDDRITHPTVVRDVNQFLSTHNPDIYNLGPFIHLSSPIDILRGASHQRLLLSFASHAIIYNDRYMHALLRKGQCLSGHTDATHNTLTLSKFTYKVPLAYQLITATENAKQGYGYVYPILNNLFVKPFGVDKRVQPGYDRLRVCLNFVSLLLFVIFVHVLFKIVNVL